MNSRFALTTSGSWEAAAVQNLFTVPARFWSLGASASETIFAGGLRRATLRQYNAQFNADVAAYRQTVLTAFQQVEDCVATGSSRTRNDKGPDDRLSLCGGPLAKTSWATPSEDPEWEFMQRALEARKNASP